MLFPSLTPAIIAVCGGVILYFFSRLYQARSAFYYSKVKKGLPMPPWNPLFGHLLVLDKAFKKCNLPSDLQFPDVFAGLSKEFQDESDSLFYLDLWPFTGPMMMVSSPDHAIQACQKAEFATDRPADLLRTMHAVTGGPSLFAINGPVWKEARNILQLGLNSNSILNRTGRIVDEAEVFIKILKEKANSNVIFQLDHLTIKYMLDVSGHLTLNQSMHCQTRSHPFGKAMRSNMEWHYLGELKSTVVRLTPLLRIITWLNARTMNNYLSEALDERYTERQTKTTTIPESNHSVIDLLLSDYMSRYKDKVPTTVDIGFKAWAIPQLRIMFFVGHDSSAATISYVFYLLFQNPSAMKMVRAENDEIFGTDTSTAPNLLRNQPQLLNKLSYTTAVIKEVLHLFPPASGFRYGRPGVDMHGEDGTRYPTDDTRVWVLHSVLHRNPRYWKDPFPFIPERFLVGPEDPLYPVKGAYRPFEHGPRDYIGQALAMSMLRISLVVLLRTFSVTPVYEEWDDMHGIAKKKNCTFEGERAYQIGQAGAHPADGFPCRIAVCK